MSINLTWLLPTEPFWNILVTCVGHKADYPWISARLLNQVLTSVWTNVLLEVTWFLKLSMADVAFVQSFPSLIPRWRCCVFPLSINAFILCFTVQQIGLLLNQLLKFSKKQTFWTSNHFTYPTHTWWDFDFLQQSYSENWIAKVLKL